ncbi:MAG TPA: acyltransferase [Armatimonadota bacterium]|jgi:peptidoglycan/LPS O-acetylase OafA/YrhL
MSAEVLPTPRASQRPGRDASLDIYKGVAICEVVAHHLTGFALNHTVNGSLSHALYSLLNRTFHFGVLGFLLLNALLQSRSQVLRPRPWGEFYRKQFSRVVIPYLMWSLLYLLYRKVIHHEHLVAILSRGRWVDILLWGKAYYHLYFLAILLQFTLLFPAFLAMVRRTRAPFLLILAAGLLLQAGVDLLYKATPPPRFPYPATLAVWHVTPLLLGCWLGVRWESMADLWRRWGLLILPLLAGALAVQLPLAIRALNGMPVNSLAIHLSLQVYAAMLALALLAFSRHLAAGTSRLGPLMARLGGASLGIYVMHPGLLHLYGKLLTRTGSMMLFHLGLLAGGVAMVALSLALTNLIAKTRLKGPLLGM